jgi:ribosomal protein S18 acetylase RimI-like enzyme
MAMVGEKEHTIADELREYEPKLFLERAGNEIVAVMGYEADDKLARGFAYGPWANDEGWDALADSLIDRVLAEVSSDTQEIDLAFNIRNERVQRFSDRHGFALVRDHFFMSFPRTGTSVAPDDAIRPMTDDDRSAVATLHERCFAGTWPSGEQLLGEADKSPDRTIFVLYEGDRLAGYHYARVDRESGDASVENIGVDDSFRGRGFATRLLTHGLWWMFGFDEITGIDLSVRAENTAALRVYEKAGFRKRHSIRQTRKPLGSRS